MTKYDDMSVVDLTKAWRLLAAHEARALSRAHSASSASISRRAAIQAAGYTARRETVEALLSAPVVP